MGERVDSDHLPLEISIEGTKHEEKGKGEARYEQKKVTVKVWDEQGVLRTRFFIGWFVSSIYQATKLS
jgi:hypothetical protein